MIKYKVVRWWWRTRKAWMNADPSSRHSGRSLGRKVAARDRPAVDADSGNFELRLLTELLEDTLTLFISFQTLKEK